MEESGSLLSRALARGRSAVSLASLSARWAGICWWLHPWTSGFELHEYRAEQNHRCPHCLRTRMYLIANIEGEDERLKEVRGIIRVYCGMRYSMENGPFNKIAAIWIAVAHELYGTQLADAFSVVGLAVEYGASVKECRVVDFPGTFEAVHPEYDKCLAAMRFAACRYVLGGKELMHLRVIACAMDHRNRQLSEYAYTKLKLLIDLGLATDQQVKDAVELV